jgi:uncharacterized tellurite resistance protein B-like protein
MGTISQIFESGEQASLKGQFHNLVMLMRVDGKVDENESKLLARMARRLSLTDEQVKEIMDDEGSYPSTPPVSKEERNERFFRLVEMVMVDGVINDSEVHLVEKYGVELGVPADKIDALFLQVVDLIREGKSKDEIIELI